MQRFHASTNDPVTWPNGATGYRPGGFNCLGPYAKVTNCPIEGTPHKRTAYATSHADSWFSVPACTRYKGQYIGGYFTSRENGIVFVPYDRFRARLAA